MSDKPSAAWYLAPIFLGIIGSVIMWYVLKDDDHPDAPKMVKKGWIIGIVLTLIDFAWIPFLLIPFLLIPFAFMGVDQEMQQPMHLEVEVRQIPEDIPEPIQQKVPAPGFEDVPEMIVQEETFQSFDCSGSARCFTGDVTDIIDGDTIRVGEQSIRFALASTPEPNEFGGLDAKQFVEQICPVGSEALVDEDDKQTEGSYGRIVAVIYCNGINLNEAVIESGYGYLDSGFCDKSEFATHGWAHGCPKTQVISPQTETQQPSCDPSYPDFCIPSPPPDLDCKDIPQKRFTVIGSDPHRFDGDKDGIGCES